MAATLPLLLALTLAPPPQETPDVNRWFDQAFVIDGALTYTRRQDPSCTKDCATELVPLAEVRRLTGVDVGTVTVSGELDRVQRNAAWVERDPGGILVRTFNDLHTARRESRYGVLMYSQQVPLLQGDAHRVADWYASGLRIVQLAYSSRVPLPHHRAKNKLAGGADEPEQGLTALGREVVHELVAHHMIIDVSHCSERTTMEVLAMTDVPILANHANAKALTVTMRGGRPLGRNKTDAELRAIAASGGVVGINTIGWMLDRDADGRADIDDFLAHVDYCVKLIGIDHVGLSSDAVVDGWGTDDIHYADAPLAKPDRWRTVTRRLRDEFDYTDAMLEKLVGGNFLRVYEAVLPGLSPPRPTAPADGALIATSDVRLSWDPPVTRGLPEPVVACELVRTEDGQPVPVEFDPAGDRATVGGLRPGRYLWRVVARSGGLAAASEDHTFTVEGDSRRTPEQVPMVKCLDHDGDRRGATERCPRSS